MQTPLLQRTFPLRIFYAIKISSIIGISVFTWEIGIRLPHCMGDCSARTCNTSSYRKCSVYYWATRSYNCSIQALIVMLNNSLVLKELWTKGVKGCWSMHCAGQKASLRIETSQMALRLLMIYCCHVQWNLQNSCIKVNLISRTKTLLTYKIKL